MNIASLAFNQEQYLTAIRFFNQINSELKNDAKLKKVYALVALEEYQQASSILSQLSKLEFSKNEMFYQLNAQVQLNIGNTKEAILAFEESLKYNTDNGATLLALGQLYEQEKDYNKALDYYSRCSGEFRDAAMLRSAGIYLLQKNYLQAIKTADIIVQSNADKVSKDTALSILKMANSIK
jgi:tetratricopeptide (TPR) repeat protein